jgi:hypothetical protein
LDDRIVVVVHDGVRVRVHKQGRLHAETDSLVIAELWDDAHSIGQRRELLRHGRTGGRYPVDGYASDPFMRSPWASETDMLFVMMIDLV